MLCWINVTFPVSDNVIMDLKCLKHFGNEDIISQFPRAETNGTRLTLSFLEKIFFLLDLEFE